MTKKNWIPASEDLPECRHVAQYDGGYYLKSDPVLCYRRSYPSCCKGDPDWTPYVVGMLYDDPANNDRYYWVDPETGGTPDVIAWMPLPSAPELSTAAAQLPGQ